MMGTGDASRAGRSAECEFSLASELHSSKFLLILKSFSYHAAPAPSCDFGLISEPWHLACRVFSPMTENFNDCHTLCPNPQQ